MNANINVQVRSCELELVTEIVVLSDYAILRDCMDISCRT